jgi:hypothetical protein
MRYPVLASIYGQLYDSCNECSLIIILVRHLRLLLLLLTLQFRTQPHQGCVRVLCHNTSVGVSPETFLLLLLQLYKRALGSCCGDFDEG